MKSAMPFHGVPVPQVRAITRQSVSQHAASHGALERDRWRAVVLRLWDDATHREHRYAALAVTRHPLFRDHRRVEPVEGLPHHFVVTGRWWDLVDETANLVQEALEGDPAVAETIRRWSRDDDLWVRRVAILSQLGRRGATDTGLLTDVLEPNLADREFFIAKACGWALRQYARTDAEWVKLFLSTHEVTPLTRREASKHLT